MRAALEESPPYVVIPHGEFETMPAQAELQLPVIASRFDKPIGFEFVRNDTTGESLVQAMCLQKFERHARVWRITCCRNDKDGVISGFKFSHNLDTLL